MNFESCNPFVNFIYFVAVMFFSAAFNHPVYMAIAFSSASFYLVLLYGKRSVKIFGFSFLFILLFTAYYASFNHFGVTVLWQNSIGNNITVEALVYGLSMGVRAAAFVLYFLCLLQVMKADKIIYLTGRIFPRLSLFISIFIRSFDRLKNMSGEVRSARKCIGKKRGSVVMWFLEGFFEAASSMRCRGYSLKRRTSFSIYGFDGRDRAALIWISFGIITSFMAYSLRLTRILYNPVIRFYHSLPYGCVYYIIYGLFSLTPVIFYLGGRLIYGKNDTSLQLSK